VVGRNLLKGDLTELEDQLQEIKRTRRKMNLKKIDTEMEVEFSRTDRFFSASGKIDIARIKRDINTEE
jgi:hypothetical protein